MIRYNIKSTALIKLYWRRYCFAPSLLSTLAVIILLPVLLSLGFWQLERAQQKKVIMADFAKRPSLPALNFQALDKNNGHLNYTPIKLQGHYDNRYNFLLDNRSYKGQSGYQVLTAFTVAQSKKIVLVNRGWIKRPRYPQKLAAIPPDQSQQITGLLYRPSKAFTLSDKFNQTQWPVILPSLQWPIIEHLLKTPVYPTIILLNPNARGGFVRDWQPQLTKPAKHIGYAVQWFGLSLTLLILFIVVNTRKIIHDHSKKT